MFVHLVAWLKTKAASFYAFNIWNYFRNAENSIKIFQTFYATTSVRNVKIGWDPWSSRQERDSLKVVSSNPADYYQDECLSYLLVLKIAVFNKADKSSTKEALDGTFKKP